MATRATGEPDAAQTPPGRGSAWLTPVNAIIALTTLLGLGLRAYLLIRPGLLAVTQYDDGPYFGSAVRLVHGGLPYRDFAFVQPPGITLLMSPAALLSYLAGTSGALVVGRAMTVLAGAASVALGGLLVRHRGPVAVFLTCGILAIYPPAAAAAHTVLLEPWLVLFSLLGMLAVFDGDRLAATARLGWGGLAFGFAGAVKAWAIVPVLVIAAACLPAVRRAAVFAAGVAAGFLVPALPFAATSPARFYDSVVVAQLARAGHRASTWARFHAMLGLPPQLQARHTLMLWMMAGVVAVAVLGTAAGWLLTSRPPPLLDRFALVTAALVAGMFLWPPYFSAHYATFLAPFLALALALPLSRLAGATGLLPGRPRARHWAAWSAAGLAGAGLVAAALIPALPGPGSRYLPAPASVISKAIPAGACVLTDQSSYLLVANRFVAKAPGCPQMVDSLGTDLALSRGLRPGTGASGVVAVRDAWRQEFRAAQYALITYRNRLRIPWTPHFRRYFARNFRPVVRTRDFVIFARRH